MPLELPESNLSSIDRLWKRSIWVCGAGRSGTSILSSLVASHLDVEYAFDPPIIHWLLALRERIEADAFDQLLRIYLYRDVFKGSLSGRKLNFNCKDLSFVKKFKTHEELNYRISKAPDEWLSSSQEEQFRLCVKVTDATFELDSLQRSLPAMSFLGIVRNPYDVIHSIHSKKWFARSRANDQINYETLPLLADPVLGPIPLWLASGEMELWSKASDWERASLYCIRATRALLEKSDDVSIVNYDWFVNHPEDLETQLQKAYGLMETPFTQKILNSIIPNKSNDKRFLKYVNSTIQDELESLESVISKLTFSFCSPH